MLLEFRVANFRSLASEACLSLVAGPGKELPGNTMASAGTERFTGLRSASIHGANASGKSNLVHAFGFLRRFVLNSSASQGEGRFIPVQPYQLDPSLADAPSRFEITFLLGGIRHQYGFMVCPKRIHEEWLTVYPKGRPQEWFHREVDATGLSSWSWSRTHLRGDKSQLAERTRDDALFLSAAAQWNHPQLAPIHRWFSEQLKVERADSRTRDHSARAFFQDPSFRDWGTGVLKAADTGIQRVSAMEHKNPNVRISFQFDIPDSIKTNIRDSLNKEQHVRIRMARGAPDGREIEWSLDEESDGTQQVFNLLAPLYTVLQSGSVLVVDELDKSLHAHVVRSLVELFHDPSSNPRQAQLVFTTHDTSLLDLTLFRRDQLWFTEKDGSGATRLYSLEDFSPRKQEAVQKGYLAGRYGAVPNLGEFPRVPLDPPADRAEAVSPGERRGAADHR